MKNFWNIISGRNWLLRIRTLRADIREIQRQQARIALAYALHREVLLCYGLEVYKDLMPVDKIIEDDQAITIVNYLDI